MLKIHPTLSFIMDLKMSELTGAILNLIMMVLINIFLVYVLVKVYRATKAVKVKSNFTNTPAIENCTLHKWEMMELYENGEKALTRYCSECGYLSQENRDRYLKEGMLKNVKRQKELVDKYNSEKNALISNFINSFNTVNQPQDQELLTRKLLMESSALDNKLWADKLGLMGIDGTEGKA